MPMPRGPRIAKTCEICGQDFETLASNPTRFCSRACYKQCRFLKPPLAKMCPTCGVSFAVARAETQRVFCSIACANRRDAAERPACLTCGVMVADPKDKFCSRVCWRISRHPKPRECPICNVTFTPFSKQRYCSPSCQQVASRRRIQVTCATCGVEFEALRCKDGRRKYCSKPCQIKQAFYSQEERAVIALVSVLLNSEPVVQQTFSWLRSAAGRPMYVDAYFTDFALAVEYDGKQHREFMPFYHANTAVFDRAQQRDRDKAELLAVHGIRLLRIRDDEPRTREHVALRLIEHGIITQQLPLPLPMIA